MGRPTLPNSPLIEVACEMRFAGDLAMYQAWGRIQADLRSAYPKLLVPAGTGVPPMLQPSQLSSADGRVKVLMSINSFAVTTRAYSNFEAFQLTFRTAAEIFHKHLPVSEYTRLGLRYINTLPAVFTPQSEERRPGTLHPCLTLELTGWNGIFPAAAEQPQLVYQGFRDPLGFRLSLLQQPDQANATTLDLDCFEMGPMASSRVEPFIHEAHEVIEDAFFAIISDEYHQYLKGEQ